MIKRLGFRQFLTLLCHYGSLGSKRGYEAEFCDDVADCLSMMCQLFMVSIYD